MMGTVDASTGVGAGCLLCRVPKELLLASVCDELVYGRYQFCVTQATQTCHLYVLASIVLDDSVLRGIPIAFKQLLLI